MLYDFLLAVACIQGSASIEAPPCPLPVIRAVAISAELMDPREAEWLLTDREAFSWQISTIRERYADLFDAPPVADAIRFPCREYCRDALQFNWQYRAWLSDHGDTFPSDDLCTALAECEACREVWDTADTIAGDYYYVAAKRSALKRLRELIGPADYYAGCLPPPVPVARFRVID